MTGLPALGGIAAVLGLILAWELVTPADDQPTPQAARPALVQVHEAAGPDLGILNDLAATALARPLFSPDRRLAPRGQAVAVADTGDDIPRLAAVIIGPAGGRAIFEDGAGHPHVAAEGDNVGRFRVGTIAPGQVSLISSEGERVLRPKYAPAAGAPVAHTAGLAGSSRGSRQ